MDIQLEKLELIKMLAETNDSDIISSIKKVFATEKKDFWDELSEEQKFEIEESEREYERGEYVDFEEFIKKHI
jgi:hypothetical protein